MTYRTTLLAGASFTAITIAGAASAELTAAEVWADWQSSLDMYGEGAVTIGSEEMSGDTLTISDLSFNMETEIEKVTATVGSIMLREVGDGTVEITMSENNPLNVTVMDEYSGTTEVAMSIVSSGMVMVASGSADEVMQ